MARTFLNVQLTRNFNMHIKHTFVISDKVRRLIHYPRIVGSKPFFFSFCKNSNRQHHERNQSTQAGGRRCDLWPQIRWEQLSIQPRCVLRMFLARNLLHLSFSPIDVSFTWVISQRHKTEDTIYCELHHLHCMFWLVLLGSTVLAPVTVRSRSDCLWNVILSICQWEQEKLSHLLLGISQLQTQPM